MLPYGRFKCLKYADNFHINSISEKSPIGYILKVDLEYPDELYVLHSDYPLAPENLAISYDMLSVYCKKIANEYEIHFGDVKNEFQIWAAKLNIYFITKISSCIWNETDKNSKSAKI